MQDGGWTSNAIVAQRILRFSSGVTRMDRFIAIALFRNKAFVGA